MLTSGHGGILPAGVPIGRVIAVDEETVLVEPSVALDQISFVSVLTRSDARPFDFAQSDFESFFAPLPPESSGRLLEGVNAAELLQ